MISIYGLKNCDTCRKALKELAASGRDAELIDVRASPLDTDKLEDLIATFGGDLINQRSKTWRDMTESERSVPQMDLLKAHPAVMKRPVVQGDGKLSLGWTAKAKADWGL